MSATQQFIVSRARVAAEKDIIEARHTKNYVRVLAIKWLEESPLELAAEATERLNVDWNVSVLEIPDETITSDGWANVSEEVDDRNCEELEQGLPNMLASQANVYSFLSSWKVSG